MSDTANGAGADLPLSGYTVIELGHSVAAPYAGLILAEMGAEVIKVERPDIGDDARAWGPPFVDDMSAVFHALNRHKKSIQVALQEDVAREIELTDLAFETTDRKIVRQVPMKRFETEFWREDSQGGI